MVLTNRLVILCALLIALSLGMKPGLCCDPDFSAAEMMNVRFEMPFSIGHLLQPFRLSERIGSGNLPEVIDQITSFDSSPNPIDAVLFMAGIALARLAGKAPNRGLHGRFIFQRDAVRLSFMRDALATGPLQTAILNFSVPSIARACVHDENGTILYVDEVDAGFSASFITSWPPLLVHHVKIWNRDGMLLDWTTKGEHSE